MHKWQVHVYMYIWEGRRRSRIFRVRNMFAFKGFCHLRGCCKVLAYIPDGLRWKIIFSLLRRLNTHYRNSRQILVGRQLSWVTSIVSRCSTDQWFMILIFLLQHPVMKLLWNSIFITELWWQHDTSLRRHPQWFVCRNKKWNGPLFNVDAMDQNQ